MKFSQSQLILFYIKRWTYSEAANPRDNYVLDRSITRAAVRGARRHNSSLTLPQCNNAPRPPFTTDLLSFFFSNSLRNFMLDYNILIISRTALAVGTTSSFLSHRFRDAASVQVCRDWRFATRQYVKCREKERYERGRYATAFLHSFWWTSTAEKARITLY